MVDNRLSLSSDATFGASLEDESFGAGDTVVGCILEVGVSGALYALDSVPERKVFRASSALFGDRVEVGSVLRAVTSVGLGVPDTSSAVNTDLGGNVVEESTAALALVGLSVEVETSRATLALVGGGVVVIEIGA